MMLRNKVGFLGCGNMGTGILSGLVSRRIVKPADIYVFDVVPAKLKGIRRQFGVKVAPTVGQLVREADVIVLAIKPQDLSSAAPEIRKGLTRRHLVITILAGVPVKRIRRELGSGVRVVRAMPNLGAVIGEAVTALTGSGRDLRIAEAVFSGCGSVVRLREKHFDLVTALSGSGPAYFFRLMELLIEEGRRLGLTEKEAALLVKQTAKGAALLALGASDTVSVLRQRVTSKGGTTEAALLTFEKHGLPRAVSQAVRNAVKRARQLGKG